MIMNKCLFPVAGYGTRFLPSTKAIPKEMLPILTKPLIQYGVEEAMSVGITNIAMVTSLNKKSIKNYFDLNEEIESIVKGSSKESLLDEINLICNKCTFSYVNQSKMLGLGHAIYTGRELIGDEPFAVILPDDLCFNEGPSVLEQMTLLHKAHPDCCIIAVQEVSDDQVHNYGIIDGDVLNNNENVYRVSKMIEKPNLSDSPSNLGIVGRYILTSSIFDTLKNTIPDKNGEIQITDALFSLARKNKVIAYKFQGKRYDCGSINGFVEATNFFAKLKGII